MANEQKLVGFGEVMCLACGETGGVRLNLGDFTIDCSECENELNAVDIAQAIGVWTRILAWLQLANKPEPLTPGPNEAVKTKGNMEL